jgi:hypothetical protein
VPILRPIPNLFVLLVQPRQHLGGCWLANLVTSFTNVTITIGDEWENDC